MLVRILRILALAGAPLLFPGCTTLTEMVEANLPNPHEGRPSIVVSLRAQEAYLYRGKTLVIYFFPKAFTTGCTIESKQFRDAAPELRELGAEVVGVSVDSHDTQCEFAKSLNANFSMIGDEDKRVSRAFDVLWPLIGKSQRVTYVIDGEGIVRDAFHHEVMVGKHLQDVLASVKKLAGKAAS